VPNPTVATTPVESSIRSSSKMPFAVRCILRDVVGYRRGSCLVGPRKYMDTLILGRQSVVLTRYEVKSISVELVIAQVRIPFSSTYVTDQF
jgi:hypothetical protein